MVGQKKKQGKGGERFDFKQRLRRGTKKETEKNPNKFIYF